MRLRAQIVVDIDADDYVEAAAHQSALQRYLEEIQQRYPNATMAMRERRERRHDGMAVEVPDPARVGTR
jgi:hypothetical protein